MEINVRDGNNLVEIWLTHADQWDDALRERLKPLYAEYRAKNYLVAVFASGQRDLCALTSDLLCSNRNRLARLAAQEHQES